METTAVWAADVATRPVDEEERKKLGRLGDSPLITSLAFAERGRIEVAVKREHSAALLGPFAGSAADVGAGVATR